MQIRSLALLITARCGEADVTACPERTQHNSLLSSHCLLIAVLHRQRSARQTA